MTEMTNQEVFETYLENEKHISFLKDTDWLVVRNLETGEGIPETVTQKRAEARNSIVDLELEILLLNSSTLNDLFESYGIFL